MPVAVFASSFTLAHLIQGQGDWYVIATVGIPLFAFVVRYLMGQRSIRENHCSALTRWFQSVVLVLGLIVIALIDCLLISLSMLIPGNPQGGGGDKLVILFCGFASAYLGYLACMTFAMYPGRERILPDEDERFSADHDERGQPEATTPT